MTVFNPSLETVDVGTAFTTYVNAVIIVNTEVSVLNAITRNI